MRIERDVGRHLSHIGQEVGVGERSPVVTLVVADCGSAAQSEGPSHVA